MNTYQHHDPAPEPPPDSRYYQGCEEEDPDQPRRSQHTFGSLFAQGLFASTASRDPYHDYTPTAQR